MTTRATLRTAISRDIRDESFLTFTTAQVNDLIDGGIAEVSLVYPLPMVEIVSPVAGVYYYPIRCETVFRAEVYRDDTYYADLPQADGPSQSGWDMHAGNLFFPVATIDALVPETDTIRVWGYGPRARPDDDTDVLELDTRAEFAVRAHARATAYRLLLSDRTLFKQWQIVSKNTDVSVNQLLTMVNEASSEWSSIRNRIRSLRRQ